MTDMRFPLGASIRPTHLAVVVKTDSQAVASWPKGMVGKSIPIHVVGSDQPKHLVGGYCYMEGLRYHIYPGEVCAQIELTT
jgi:hypothetical protein